MTRLSCRSCRTRLRRPPSRERPSSSARGHVVKGRKLPKGARQAERVSARRQRDRTKAPADRLPTLFENQPRIRTFVEGAWREFGYVYFLRSAASVTPAELAFGAACRRRVGHVHRVRERLLAECRRRAGRVEPKGRVRYTNVGHATIRVRDRYAATRSAAPCATGGSGGWPSTRCWSASTWSSSTCPASGRRTPAPVTSCSALVDRFPIERVVFLVDPREQRSDSWPRRSMRPGHSWPKALRTPSPYRSRRWSP